MTLIDFHSKDPNVALALSQEVYAKMTQMQKDHDLRTLKAIKVFQDNEVKNSEMAINISLAGLYEERGNVILKLGEKRIALANFEESIGHMEEDLEVVNKIIQLIQELGVTDTKYNLGYYYTLRCVAHLETMHFDLACAEYQLAYNTVVTQEEKSRLRNLFMKRVNQYVPFLDEVKLIELYTMLNKIEPCTKYEKLLAAVITKKKKAELNAESNFASFASFATCKSNNNKSQDLNGKKTGDKNKKSKEKNKGSTSPTVSTPSITSSDSASSDSSRAPTPTATNMTPLKRLEKIDPNMMQESAKQPEIQELLSAVLLGETRVQDYEELVFSGMIANLFSEGVSRDLRINPILSRSPKPHDLVLIYTHFCLVMALEVLPRRDFSNGKSYKNKLTRISAYLDAIHTEMYRLCREHTLFSLVLTDLHFVENVKHCAMYSHPVTRPLLAEEFHLSIVYKQNLPLYEAGKQYRFFLEPVSLNASENTLPLDAAPEQETTPDNGL